MMETEAAMKIVRLGRAARSAAGIKVRRPVAMQYLKPADSTEHEALQRDEQYILDELNVKGIAIIGCADEINVDSISIVEEGDTVVGLDTVISENLIREGLVRDLVRHIQNLRKESGFDVNNHIKITYHVGKDLADAIAAYMEYIYAVRLLRTRFS